MNDSIADPLFYVTAPVNDVLLSMMDEKILPEVRSLVGDSRRVTMIFDREGWSPKTFEKWYKEGFLGRQLLSIRNRIVSEADPSRLRKLRRREIRILLQLGNLAAAGDICEKLVRDNPSWPPGYSIMADLSCHTGKWDEAEKLFERAAAEHESEGNAEAAVRLRIGPVYRLVEARNDYDKCLSLCSGDGDLKSILNVRSRRLLTGQSKTVTLPEPDQWLA